jgi:hypothetical protein
MSGTKRRRVKGQTELLARLVPGLRPQLTASDRVALGICHIETLDAIATGKADVALLWDWIETTLTWLKAAELIQQGVPEMLQQLDLVTRVAERQAATQRVLFTGPDYQIAKAGVDVMDQLARVTDKANFAIAGAWAAAKTREMKAASAPRAVEAAAA